MKVTAKQVKDFLGKNGIKVTKDLKVRCSHNVIEVCLNSFSFSQIEIQKLLSTKFERIDKCELTGEILSGGNLFVFVDYGFDFMENLASTKLAELQKEKPNFDDVVKEISDKDSIYNILKSSDNVEVVVSVKDRTVYFSDKTPNGKSISYPLTYPYLARALMLYDNAVKYGHSFF